VKNSTLAILFFSVLCLSCKGQPAKYATIPPLAFAEKIKAAPDAQLIDVRSPEEFKSQHIDNAANINWNGDDFETKASKLDKSKPVFVYCTRKPRISYRKWALRKYITLKAAS